MCADAGRCEGRSSGEALHVDTSGAMWRRSPDWGSSDSSPCWVASRVRVRAVAYPKDRCRDQVGHAGEASFPSALPDPPIAPTQLVLCVHDEPAVDHVGQATFQTPRPGQGCLALTALAPVVVRPSVSLRSWTMPAMCSWWFTRPLPAWSKWMRATRWCRRPPAQAGTRRVPGAAGRWVPRWRAVRSGR